MPRSQRTPPLLEVAERHDFLLQGRGSNNHTSNSKSREDIMITNHIKTIVVNVYLGCLATSLALAQSPFITTQPSDKFVDLGKNATFSVLATGVAPITYQWLFDGTAIAGATNRALPLTNAQPVQSGYYSAIVSNASGSVTSQVAVLKVFLAAEPHGFSSIQAQSNGSVSLNFKGETTTLFGPYYGLYPVETSTNLIDWIPLVTLQSPNKALDTLQFLDADAPQFNQRFYRTPTNQLATFLPKPTGPYPVGVVSRLLTDSSRTNRRPFMVSIWYPAVTSAGVLPNNYMDPRIAAGYATTFIAHLS
jgi:hypothetical protein